MTTSTSLDLISSYIAALQARNGEEMVKLRSPEYVRDLVAGDAFLDTISANQEIAQFWTAWFDAFEDMDYEVTRTVAAESVVVLEWTFTGTHTGQLNQDVFGREIEATGNTVRLRGVSVYEIENSLITRETLYIDMATLWLELGVVL